MWNAETIPIIVVAFLLGGIAKGVTGLGLPIVVLTILAATVGLKEAMGLLIVPGVIANIWQALAGGAFLLILQRMWPLLVASVLGIWCGVQILALADPRVLIAILGLILFVYSVVSLISPQISPPGAELEKWLSPVMGAIAGFVFGLTGSYMVPGVLYIQSLGLSRHLFVQMLGITFCIIMISLGIFMAGNQLMPLETALISAAGLVPTSLGMILGQRLRHRMSEHVFRLVLFLALIAAGIYMMVRAMF
jgi:hypothetical protein